MINRYTLINTSHLLNVFNNDSGKVIPIYNAFPTSQMPIITLSESNKMTLCYWGSTSEISKNKAPAERLINVNINKLKKSNMLLNQFKFNRCLIPCDGFFLWKKKNLKEKIPYYFKFIKEKYMYCIGIKDVYEDYSGNKFEYFSFLTTKSSFEWNKFTKNIPIVMDHRYLDIWFDKKSTFEKINSFLSTTKFTDFKNHTVSPYFEKNLNEKSLIEPKRSSNQYGNYSLFD